jgi:IS5 family transposase
MLKVAQIWGRVQGKLFGRLELCLETKLTARQRRLVAILELVRIEEHVPSRFVRRIGRPLRDRRALARAFVAKAFYNLPHTTMLIEMLRTDATLLAICGWRDLSELPDEATFSRAFAEFATSQLCDRVHAALVKEHVSEHLVGHISRDSTAIEAREKPAKKAPKPVRPQRRPGRPKKGEVIARPSEPPTRLPRQLAQDPQEALAELPTACDVGAKRNSKGHTTFWIGYKMHLDVNDAGLPITAVTTSASLHDSQVAIPLEKLTAQRVTSLYALMDSAYDARLIEQCCQSHGHVPIIDRKQRRGGRPPWDPATAHRYQERTAVERANSRLKDHFGGRHLRVRGHAKAHAHLMFGLVVLFADQLLQLVT